MSQINSLTGIDRDQLAFWMTLCTGAFQSPSRVNKKLKRTTPVIVNNGCFIQPHTVRPTNKQHYNIRSQTTTGNGKAVSGLWSKHNRSNAMQIRHAILFDVSLATIVRASIQFLLTAVSFRTSYFGSVRILI